ncbi:hypothetical protein ACVWXN_003495 [Bradyrhizobium sp. i1.4.4]
MAEEAMAGPGPDKTRGQQVLERLVGQLQRTIRIHQQLRQVRDHIDPVKNPRVTAASAELLPAAPATSFFEGLERICEGFDMALDEVEVGVSEIGDLF